MNQVRAALIPNAAISNEDLEAFLIVICSKSQGLDYDDDRYIRSVSYIGEKQKQALARGLANHKAGLDIG